MDFIYSRLNNNLIDINRLDAITLLKCEKDGAPIESLKVGDYYLKFTIVDSDKVSYCDLSSLNSDDKDLLDRIINDEKTFDQRISDLDKSVDERITKDEEYFDERCLYKSTTNASKWESKEGSFTGYLGNSSETAVKAKVGFNIENNVSYLPSYPTVTGTYYAFNNQDNALTGKLNLTPINSNASPLFTFTGSGALSMGQRNIYLASDWFTQSTDNINLCLPAKSGTLITENDAMGCLDLWVDDLETEKIELTADQFNYLSKYPKSMFALHKQQYSWPDSDYGNYRCFYKINYYIPLSSYDSVDFTFMAIVSGTCIGIARLQRESAVDYLVIKYYNNASKEELDKVQTLLDQEIVDRKSALETEQKERKDANDTLQSNIDNEAAARDAADWELQQNIDTEQSARETADTTFRTAIDALANGTVRVIEIKTSEFSGSLTDEQYNLIASNKAIVAIKYANESTMDLYTFSNFLNGYINNVWSIYQYNITGIQNESDIKLCEFIINTEDKTWRLEWCRSYIVTEIGDAFGKITLDDTLQMDSNKLSINIDKIATKSSVDDLIARVTALEQTVAAINK